MLRPHSAPRHFRPVFRRQLQRHPEEISQHGGPSVWLPLMDTYTHARTSPDARLEDGRAGDGIEASRAFRSHTFNKTRYWRGKKAGPLCCAHVFQVRHNCSRVEWELLLLYAVELRMVLKRFSKRAHDEMC